MKGKFAAAGLLALFLSLVFCAVSDEAVAAEETTSPGKALTVDDCVRIALEHNYSVAIAHGDIDASRSAEQRAWSGLLPQVSANTYWDRLTQGPTEQLTLNERTGEIIVAQTQSQAFVSYTMGLNASQSLFSWQSVQNLARARADVSASRYASTAAENDVAYQVKAQFYTVVKAQKLLEVSEESLERSNKQLERAQSLFELGSVAKSDVLKAKVNVAQSELDLISARNAVEMERARLAKIMGLGLQAPLEISMDLDFEEVDVAAEQIYESALNQRPDLLEARERVNSAKAGVQAARGGGYPSLFGSFNYRWRDNQFPNSTSDLEKRYTWDVAMGISFPIFDGMVTRGSVGEAKAGLITRRNQMRDMELSVELDVKEALTGLEEARQKIRVSEDQVASAEESYKLAQEQYEVGLGTILELTDAQVELTTAESQRVEAITSYKTALALLDRASGRPVSS
jgi:outer membrane protein